MLCLLSPSKTLHFEEKKFFKPITEPFFKSEIQSLVSQLKSNSKGDIKKLMSLSNNLSELNYQRYQDFDKNFQESNSEQAILAFRGDVYEGLDANSLTEKQLNIANNKVAILSGLYGLLQPFDLIQPYRLEMGTKLKTNKGESLYDFWGDKITKRINEVETKNIINLASNEYFKAVKPKQLKAKLTNVIFKEDKNEKVSVIAIYAKKARGFMARHIVENDIDDVDGLKKFNVEGYKYIESMSDDDNFTFLRKH